MGMGVSLIVIAVGAILTWAVTDTSSAIDLDAVGIILMAVGLVGFLLSLAFWSSWWGPGYFRRSYAAAGPDPYAGRRVVRRRAAAPVADEVEVVEEGTLR